MSHIIIKAVPEELKGIAEKGNLIMYDDLSLYIKTQSGTIEKIKGKDYNRIMDYLEKSMTTYYSKNQPFTKRFTENESQILVYETDTDMLLSVDENMLKSETGLKIKYEVGMVPEYFSPMTEMAASYYLNDPANSNNPTFLLDIITSMRNRLTYIQSILDICILNSAVNTDLNDKYLLDGAGFDNDKYPYLKNITDDIATGNADTGIIETNLANNYIPKGASFNTTKYPNVKSVVNHFSNVKLRSRIFMNTVLNDYLLKGDTYNMVKYPNIQSIIVYINSLMDTIKSVFTSLVDKVNVGTPLQNYPDTYAIVTKLTTLASNIANIKNTIDAMKDKVSNYLPKGDTTYPSVAYLVSEIDTVKVSDATHYSMYGIGETAPSQSLDTALELAISIESLIDKVKTKITDVTINKLPYSETFDTTTYPNAQTIADKLSNTSADISNQEEEFNTFITDVFPLYMKKNGFVPYDSFYKMYLAMLDIQKRIVKIDRVLNSTVAQVTIDTQKFTEVPKIFMGFSSSSLTEIWTYLGGSSSPICGTRLHSYYFATCVRDDAGNAGTCDPVFQMAYKDSTGKYRAIKLPWEEWAEGTWDTSEYRDHILTWIYGATSYTSHGGYGGSVTTNFNISFTFAANRNNEGILSESEHDNTLWSDQCFAAGCRGVDDFMYALTFTGNLIKIDVAAWAAACVSSGNTVALGDYATAIKNLITGDSWLDNATFSSTYFDSSGNDSAKQGFGYWSRNRSHIIDTGRVGGNRIIALGSRLSAGQYANGGPGANILCVYDKIKNKSTLLHMNSGYSVEITFITPLNNDLLYYESSIFNYAGIIEIVSDGSELTLKRHYFGGEAYNVSKAFPIMCAIQNTEIIFVMDAVNGTYHFVHKDNIDIEVVTPPYGGSDSISADKIFKRTDTFGVNRVDETPADSPYRMLLEAARTHSNPKDSSSYNLFTGVNDGAEYGGMGRHIVYEPDQDDIMTLCVNNCRFKFTAKTEGIVITGEAFPIT